MVSIDKAAIYCRLSKEDEDKINQGDESASIQNQKMLLVDYAIANKFAIYEIYTDDDYSGLDSDRPSFNKLIRDAMNGSFNTIICKTQSRFTRDMELVEKYLHGLFPIIGVRFIGVVDNVDTNIKGNKKARQINGLINEWYSEDLSENIRTVFRAKMEKGEFLGAFACYGYKKDPLDRHKLIIDEEAAEVVRKIFGYAVQGLGNKQICDRLYEEKIPTPIIYKKTLGLDYKHSSKENYGDKYGIWGTTTIQKMLTNRMYIGDMVQGRERKLSYKSKKVVAVPESEWIIVPDCHEPIIDKEVFYIVNELKKTRRYVSTLPDNKKGISILSGKVKCEDCGSTMTRINGEKDYVYLYCQLYKRSKKTLCTSHSIRYETLVDNLEHRIRNIIQTHLEHTNLSDEIQFKSDDKILLSKKRTVLSSIKEKLENTTKALSMLYVDKVSGTISENEYFVLKESLNEEINSLNFQCKKTQEELDKLLSKNDSQERKEDIIHKYANFEKLDHEIVNEFVDHIEVGEKDKDKNQEVIIHWRF